MDRIGLFESIDQLSEYRKMLPKDRVQLRKKRLYELVTYASANSPLYKDIYEDVPTNFELCEVSKQESHKLHKYQGIVQEQKVRKGGLPSDVGLFQVECISTQAQT